MRSLSIVVGLSVVSVVFAGDVAPIAAAADVKTVQRGSAVERSKKEFEQVREKTQSLMEKFHKDMQSISSSLKQTDELQHADLEVLKNQHRREVSELDQVQESMHRQLNKPVTLKNRGSSFLQNDLLTPLRSAADDVKSFAEKVRSEEEQYKKLHNRSPNEIGNLATSMLETENKAPVSTLEGEDALTDKAQRSLSLAEEALSHLNSSVNKQRKDLERQQLEQQKAHDKFLSEKNRDGNLARLDLSRLKTGGSLLEEDNQPQRVFDENKLKKWKEDFMNKLAEARKASGLTETAKHEDAVGVSLLEMGRDLTQSFAEYGVSEESKEKQREAQRKREEFDEKMEEMKKKNKEMLEHTRIELEDAKAKAAEFEKSRSERRSSLVQLGDVEHKFDVEKTRSRLKGIQREFQKEVSHINKNSTPPSEKSASSRVHTLLEAAKEKSGESEKKMETLKKKTEGDLAKLHKELAAMKAKHPEARERIKARASSFVEEKEDGIEKTDMADKVLEHVNKELKGRVIQVNARKMALDAKKIMKLKENDSVKGGFLQQEEQKAKLPDRAEEALSKAERDLEQLERQLRQPTTKTHL